MIDNDGTVVPSRIARLKTKLSNKIEENKIEYAYFAGVAIGTVSATAGAVIVARYRINNLETSLLVMAQELDMTAQVAEDLIEFVEANNLKDKALKFINKLAEQEDERVRELLTTGTIAVK